MTDTAVENHPQDRASGWIDAVAVWVLLAAVGQLLHLALWPMFVLNRHLAPYIAFASALLHLGVYAGIGFGLLQRERGAWAAAVLELFRTAILFWLLNRSEFRGGVYPAAWAQGLLSGALPWLLIPNLALGLGWRPGSALEYDLFVLERFLAVFAVVTGLWLRRQSAWFGIPPGPAHKELPPNAEPVDSPAEVLLQEGLPVVLFLSSVEAIAWYLSR